VSISSVSSAYLLNLAFWLSSVGQHGPAFQHGWAFQQEVSSVTSSGYWLLASLRFRSSAYQLFKRDAKISKNVDY